MPDESLEQLAERVGTPIDRLLLQIEEAGLLNVTRVILYRKEK